MQRMIVSFAGLSQDETDTVVHVDGRDYPSPCLFEDEQGIRTFAISGFRECAVSAATWGRAFADAPSALAFWDTGQHRWWGITVERWMDLRREVRLTGQYVIDAHFMAAFHSFPSYFEIAGSTNEASSLNLPAEHQHGLVHLHAHSEFSALDGFSHVAEMVEQAVLHGQEALALTDHGVCAGHPALQAEAKKAGIKPIFGIEAYFVDDRTFRPMRKPTRGLILDDQWAKALAEWEEQKKRGNDYWHLVMWAQNDTGLRNLWAMSSEAQREGKYRHPRMDWDTLSRFSEGVMVSTACLRGPLSEALINENHELAQQRLGRLMDIFDGRVHIELHTNQLPEQRLLNERLVAMASDYSLPVVAVSDSHYPTDQHQQCHKVWIAAQIDKELQEDGDLFAGNEEYHLLGEPEARQALSYLPARVVDEAISNTGMVAQQCDASIKVRDAVPVFSKRPTPEESIHRDVERLVEICMSNWHKTLGKTYPQEVYEARFEKEMKLLISKRFAGYYLMVADYCRWARAQGILVGPGRGSGGGSLVAYLANITEIDPVDAELIFERFLTEGRKGLPDFDVDFPSSKSDDLTAYVIGLYGEDHVVRVGSHMYMRNKKTVRSMAKVLGSTIDIHYPDIDAICTIIDQAEADSAGLGRTWDEVWVSHPDEYELYSKKYPLLFEMAEAVVGRLSGYGKHAAGWVISPSEPLKGEIPLRYDADTGFAIAEWNMTQLEEIGLNKFDLLTIRNLDTLQVAVDLDRQLTGEVIDLYSWKDEYHDEAVWDEICAGRTLGMFQIETYAGTAMCKRQKPRTMNDLADVITLVRPGPMRSGLTDTYLRRRFGEEAVTFPHPLLEETLKKTYGCILYQEDVMNVCMVLAGYDENEADAVRKILGKKQVEAAKKAGEKFMLACDARGVARSVSEPLWAQMEEFAKYSFNRAHAYGYAVIAYWCAWLKVHTPLAFLTAILSTVDGKRLPDFIEEARQRGFTPLGPDINTSDRRFSVVSRETSSEAQAVRYGITDLNGVGDAAYEAIVQARPYVSFDDFLERRGTKCDSGVVDKLVRIGAFDSIEPSRAALVLRWEWLKRAQDENLCIWRHDTHNGPNGLPCTRDWSDVPVELKRDGTPKKAQKGPPKACTRGCWKYEPARMPDFSTVPEFNPEELRNIEMDMLGVYLSSTPFSDLDQANVQVCSTGPDLETVSFGNEMLVCVQLTSLSSKKDRNGREMGFFTFLTHDGYNFRAVAFSKTWDRLKSYAYERRLYWGVVTKNDRGWSIVGLEPA